LKDSSLPQSSTTIQSTVPALWENNNDPHISSDQSEVDNSNDTANEFDMANETNETFVPESVVLNTERGSGANNYGTEGSNGNTLQRAFIGGGNNGGNSCLENAYSRYIGELEQEAAATASMEAAISQRQAAVYGESDRRRSKHQQEVKELQRFIKDQMAAKAAEREAGAARARALGEKTALLSSADILTRDAGVADVLGAPKPQPEVDTSQMSPRTAMVHRMQTKITDGGIRGKGQSPLSRSQLLTSLQGQIGAKQSLFRSRKESELNEERRYLEHVKAEMHLHSTYARAAELGKQRDLLAAWERDGHLKNLNKLKNLGPAAMRDYAQGIISGTPTTSAVATAPNLASARPSSSRLITPRPDTLSRSSARTNFSVGFDPRST